MAKSELAGLKGDDRKWKIEDAARTLKSFAKLKRDPELLKAAREELKREIKDSQNVLKTI